MTDQHYIQALIKRVNALEAKVARLAVENARLRGEVERWALKAGDQRSKNHKGR